MKQKRDFHLAYKAKSIFYCYKKKKRSIFIGPLTNFHELRHVLCVYLCVIHTYTYPKRMHYKKEQWTNAAVKEKCKLNAEWNRRKKKHTKNRITNYGKKSHRITNLKLSLFSCDFYLELLWCNGITGKLELLLLNKVFSNELCMYDMQTCVFIYAQRVICVMLNWKCHKMIAWHFISSECENHEQ